MCPSLRTYLIFIYLSYIYIYICWSRISNEMQLHVLYTKRLIHHFSPKHEWKKSRNCILFLSVATAEPVYGFPHCLSSKANRCWVVTAMWYEPCLCYSHGAIQALSWGMVFAVVVYRMQIRRVKNILNHPAPPLVNRG